MHIPPRAFQREKKGYMKKKRERTFICICRAPSHGTLFALPQPLPRSALSALEEYADQL